jgi:hypothetical protein
VCSPLSESVNNRNAVNRDLVAALLDPVKSLGRRLKQPKAGGVVYGVLSRNVAKKLFRFGA